MRRWAGWLALTLVVVAFAYLCFTVLAPWQLGKNTRTERENNQIQASLSADPVSVTTLLPQQDSMAPDAQWRRVTASGTYLPDEQLIEVNRSQDGAAGVNVVTPMRLDDGTVLLVNRGFAPSPDMTNADAPPAPPGTVRVEGRLRVSDERTFGGFTEPAGELTQIQRIDIPRLAPQLPTPLAPVYLDLVSSRPADEALRPVPDPELTEGPHLSYMLQWWFFSLCVVVGWALAVRRSVGQRRRDAEQALSRADGRTEPDSPPPADDEPATAPT